MVMPTTINKQRQVVNIFSSLAKGKHAEPEPRPVLEQFLYAICREGVTREQADRAYRVLREKFYDWNEVRVSSTRELAEALAALPDAEQRAQRLVDFLQEVFETTFSFDLESLQKKGLKQAAKQLARYQAANDYAVAWVTQQSLGGHAIPLDAPAMRVLRRLGMLEGDTPDMEALRASIEHHIPKARGWLFSDLISALAEDHCWDGDPDCPGCPLHNSCPSAQEFKATVAAGGGRSKPR
jgi:endonuclease III